MKKALLSMLVLLIPCQVWAHEGHGVPGHGDTVSHYLLDPWHLPLALFAAGMAAVAILAMRKRILR